MEMGLCISQPLPSAYHSETLLALKADSRQANMDSTASNSLSVGVGKVKSRSVEASAVLLERRACASSTERTKVPMGIHVRGSHWRSLERDKNLTKVIPGYGCLSGVSLVLGKWPFG